MGVLVYLHAQQHRRRKHKNNDDMRRITTIMAVLAIATTACTTNNKNMDIKNIPLITIEEHFSDTEIIEANAQYAYLKPKPTGKMAEAMAFFQNQRLIGQDLLDIEERRLPHMDEYGIGMQILSYTAPIDDVVPADEAVLMARRANDILAARVAEHPDRFRAMATLPMADPEAAAAELERCVKELGFVGVLLTGQYKGRFYDEPEFFPIFEKAAELDIPVYWHPDFVNSDIIDYYYMSDSYSAIVGAELSSAGFGWHIDVGIHVARMVLRHLRQAAQPQVRHRPLGRGHPRLPRAHGLHAHAREDRPQQENLRLLQGEYLVHALGHHVRHAARLLHQARRHRPHHLERGLPLHPEPAAAFLLRQGRPHRRAEIRHREG